MAKGPGWRFYKFGLLVTGEGEEDFLPQLFRSLTVAGNCHFEVIRRVPQLSPRKSHQHKLKLVGTQKQLPSRDQEIGLAARGWLSQGGTHVLLVDDLEHDRADERHEIFQRYRQALDAILGQRRHLASVHFLVNMLEAYYFADTRAPNAVLRTELTDCTGDVEAIRHPKNDLKRLSPGFDEKSHGKAIVKQLDVVHVLSRVDTCASLRVLFAWCVQALGQPVSPRYQLDAGCYDRVTGPQLKQ